MGHGGGSAATDQGPSGGAPAAGGSSGAPAMLDQSAHCRIKRNDGSGGVQIDRVSKQALAWHFRAERWTPWVSTGRDEAGDWDPGSIKDEDATAVWFGHRKADPDKLCKGFVSQVFYLPVNAHSYGSDPDGNSIHRWEIGIDRAHHHHTDIAHGPLHHIGIFPWPRGSGIRRPVFMHFWSKAIGGDDKWHWFTVTPGVSRPTPVPRRPTPHPGRPSEPPSRPTQPTGGGTTPSGGSPTPSSPVPGTTPNPYSPGGTLPPGTPSAPTNPYSPGGKYGPGAGAGGGGLPPDTPGAPGPFGPPVLPPGGGGGFGPPPIPLPGQPGGPLNPFPGGPTAGGGATSFSATPTSVWPGPGPQFEMAEMTGEQSVYEGGISIDNQIVNPRSVASSRFALGTPPLENSGFLPERVSRWSLGTQPPADRGALAKPRPVGAVAWTAEGLKADTWQQSEVGALDENDQRVAYMSRMNELAKRLEALNLQNRLPIRGAALARASASTATVGTAAFVSAMADSAQEFLIEFTGALTADITVSGAGGLAADETEAADTWYAVHVIADTGRTPGISRLREPNDPALLLSTSKTAPTLPTGYNVFRHVGWLRNDGSSDFLDFTQTGDGSARRYEYDEDRTTLQVLAAGNATTFAAVSMTSLIPIDVRDALLAIGLDPQTVNDGLRLRPTGSAVLEVNAVVRLTPGVTQQVDMLPIQTMIGPSQDIDYAVTSVATLADIYVTGFVDHI